MASKKTRSESKSNKSNKPKQPSAVPTSVAHAVTAQPVAVALVDAARKIEAPRTAEAPRAIETRDRSAIVALIAKLRDTDAEIARDAAANLGRLPADSEAVAALAAVLFNADGYFHAVVRVAAASALGQIGDRNAVDALVHATSDSMAETSEEAIHALGLLGDRRALPALEAVVGNDNGFFLEHVRQRAREAIARLGK